MIDEKQLIEIIQDHKKFVVCGNPQIDFIYGSAHDHIINLIEILVKNTKQSEGEWTYGVDREGTMKCTLCRRRMPKIEHARYCPNCGAKMKGGE